MAIAALAQAGALFGRPDLVAAAENAAGLLVSAHYGDGRIARTSRTGLPGRAQGCLRTTPAPPPGCWRLPG